MTLRVSSLDEVRGLVEDFIGKRVIRLSGVAIETRRRRKQHQCIQLTGRHTRKHVRQPIHFGGVHRFKIPLGFLFDEFISEIARAMQDGGDGSGFARDNFQLVFSISRVR